MYACKPFLYFNIKINYMKGSIGDEEHTVYLWNNGELLDARFFVEYKKSQHILLKWHSKQEVYPKSVLDHQL